MCLTALTRYGLGILLLPLKHGLQIDIARQTQDVLAIFG